MDYKDLQQLRERAEPLPLNRSLPYFGAGLGIGLAIGLGIGLCIAWLVELRQHDSTEPLQHVEEVTPSPQKTTKTLLPPPEFGFYTMLPEMEVRIDDLYLEAATEGGKPLPDGHYFLQLGSYRQQMEAGQLQKKLLQAGIETQVRNPESSDGGTWYQVRAGPYHALQELNRVRTQLRRSGVPFTVSREIAPSPTPETNQ